MLTYENFVAVLLTAIEQTDLNIAYTQELLDTHALGRSLSITCLPRGIEDDRAPEEPPLRAVIAFRWSPEFTVFSLRGGPPDSFDGIVDERILASPAGVGIEIDVTYTLPMIADPMRDLAALPQIARAVHELHASVAPASENPVRIDVALSFPQAPAATHQDAGDSPDLADRRRAVRRRPAARYFRRAVRRAARCPRSAGRGLPRPSHARASPAHPTPRS